MKRRLKKVSEQVIVITGASSGIGLATARRAARQGARLVLASRNREALDDLVRELQAAGCQAIRVVADVGRREDVQGLAHAAIERFGGFDTWVNNAGVSIYGPIRETTLEDQRRLFETNYWGVVNGSLVASEHLRERPGGGAIINVGSVNGLMAFGNPGYSAGKAGLLTSGRLVGEDSFQAGWIIQHRDDERDEISLYERYGHICRVFYDHPDRWREHMVHALSLAHYFNTHRVVREYQERAWTIRLY